VIVVDTSVLAPALADDGPDGDVARKRIAGQALLAPEIVDLEVASVLRRQCASGVLTVDRAAAALTDLVQLRMRRVAHRWLLPRCWELRSNLTTYDASYVALAESMELVLVTGDSRLAHAPGVRCDVDLVA
jgi:predicted nucleic acid-binding protein